MKLPTGTVTLMFTDIQGSTRLLERVGDDYAELLPAHDAILRDALARHGGRARPGEDQPAAARHRRATTTRRPLAARRRTAQAARAVRLVADRAGPLERYGAGRCMDYETDGPAEIGAAISEEIGRDVERDGAARAAELIADLL